MIDPTFLNQFSTAELEAFKQVAQRALLLATTGNGNAEEYKDCVIVLSPLFQALIEAHPEEARTFDSSFVRYALRRSTTRKP